MNQSLGTQDQSRSSQELLHPLPAILKLLTLVQADRGPDAAFSQALTVQEFRLGDELVNYAPHASTQPSNEDLYLVCRGRVRLLCFDQARQREVSALVVEEDETFGADHLFCNVSLPYRAIAASPAQLARISTANLQTWLAQLPTLHHYLAQQAQQRERLLFFKSTTALRSLPSQRLRQFVPYVATETIAAGALLVQATPANLGHFWLRSGQIESKTGESRLSAIGESWGYPDPTPADWVAHIDLVVYRLPAEHWEMVQGIGLRPVPASQEESGRALRQAPSAQRAGYQLHPPQRQSVQSRSDRQRSVHQPEPESVAFPKPITRRRLGRWLQPGYPVIRQQSAADCGAACLAMVGRYWGKQFSLNTLRDLARVGRAGASLKSLAKAGESLGFHARPVRASFSRLKEQINPWIAHWQGDHYVVVYRVRGGRVLIADPAVGRRSLSLSEFQTGWTGYALLLEDV